MTIDRKKIRRGEAKHKREQIQMERLQPKTSPYLRSNTMSHKPNEREIVQFANPECLITEKKLGEKPNHKAKTKLPITKKIIKKELTRLIKYEIQYQHTWQLFCPVYEPQILQQEVNKVNKV